MEASLTSLTPKEGGKLHLLYLQEAARKGIKPLSIAMDKYRPTQELEEAFEHKTDFTSELSRKQLKGFLFLSVLSFTTLAELERGINELIRESLIAHERLYFILTADQVTEVAREATEELARQPRPLKVNRYQRLLQWSEENGSDWVENIAEIAADWEAEEKFEGEILELSFEDRRRLMQKRSRFPYLEDEECRRDWLAEQGEDQVLAQHFDGDRDRLEDWLVEGGYTNSKAYEDFAAHRKAEIIQKLTEAYEAGQLEGYEATSLEVGTFFAIPVTKGQIPAWAALRRAWPDWLQERGYLTHLRPFPSDPMSDYSLDWPGPVNIVYTVVDGQIDSEDLTNLVGAFVEECRKRPWGDSLKTDGIDFAGLARFLTAEASPLDHIDAPDLGAVDWLTFAEDVGESPDTYIAILSRSLEAAADQLGLSKMMRFNTDKFLVQQRYFPAENPWLTGLVARAAADKLSTIRLDYPAFMYDEESRWSPIFGEFKTPLQVTIDWLGSLFGKLETLKLAMQLISDSFFDGLPLLTVELEKELASVEKMLKGSEDALQDFLGRLQAYPWLVDVDRLKLTPAKGNEAVAINKYAGPALMDALAIIEVGRSEIIDLGAGDFRPLNWLQDRLKALESDQLLKEGGASEEV